MADKEFCDITVKDSLLTNGGIFNFNDVVYIIRNYKKDDNIVWRLHELKQLFPGIESHFEFVSHKY